MLAGEFFVRALKEGERYGADSYVFLRELAQNSRDAGANSIKIGTTLSDDARSQEVSIVDDGRGMSFEHARAYLFRLYASSKEDDPESVGHFGVGFWSILRWAPDAVEVHSRTSEESWGVRIDSRHGDIENIPCAVQGQSGTLVILRRTTDDAPAFREEVRAAARRHCRYVRIQRRRLRVTLDGRRIDEAMALPGPFSLSFSERDICGVVGLGEQPRVELYARGLLVTTVTFLEELLPGEQVPERRTQAQGLSPVIILDSDRLELVLSRQAPVVSRELRRIVGIARARVRRLVDRVIDEACPTSWADRFRDKIADMSRAYGGLPNLAVGVVWILSAGLLSWLVLGPLGLVSLPEPGQPSSIMEQVPDEQPSETVVRVQPRPGPRERPRSYANIRSYRGARVDSPVLDAEPWGLSYQGPPSTLFKVLTLDHYDPDRGWLSSGSEPTRTHPPMRCNSDCLSVSLNVAEQDVGDEPLVLPVPTGFRVDPDSVTFQGAPVRGLVSNEAAEALLRLPAKVGGEITYRVGLSPRQRAVKVEPTTVSLPAEVADSLRALRGLGVRMRAARATELIKEAIHYDVSPYAVARFESIRGTWIDRVFALGAGDCDVKNGLNVIALRQLGIAARMAVGIVGANGEAQPGLHAWTEYFFRGRWHVLDASGTPRPDQPAVAGAAALPYSGTGQSALPPAATRDSHESDKSTAAANEPVAAVAPAQPSQIDRPSTGFGAWRHWSIMTTPILCGAILMLMGWLWRGRSQEQFAAKGDEGAERTALAKILADALQQPEAWRYATGLWQRRVLPLLRGRPISIAEALHRAREGELWMSRSRCRLAAAAADAGTVVLDAGDPTFGDLLGALGRATDLDALDAILPNGAMGGTADAMNKLSDATNALLHETGASVCCAPCDGLETAEVLDIDLSSLKLPPDAPWPRRFVAINPRAAAVAARAAGAAENPGLGFFLWIDWLLDRSRLLADDARQLREAAAVGALPSSDFSTGQAD